MKPYFEPNSVLTRRRVLSVVAVAVAIVLLAYGITRALQRIEGIATINAPQRKAANAPYITSPNEIIAQMIELGQISSQDLVFDLGCGDGRIVIQAAASRRCRGVGFDIDPELVKLATANAAENGVSDLVRFEQRDIFTIDLSEANVIVMYLVPWMVNKLVPQFEKCRPGTRIVSHEFALNDFVYNDMITLEHELDTHTIYLYETPLQPIRDSVKEAIQP
ncbi:MAG TPA: methyltransferase domain-containing protein [Pirellulaceae bacterium]|nr:methyltransferase domain-containing protein [Pirellulaceae bacterium]HMP67720.1 methyltransferase domain-containing protein [Pirellulaceae bacterium]